MLTYANSLVGPILYIPVKISFKKACVRVFSFYLFDAYSESCTHGKPHLFNNKIFQNFYA